MNTSEATASRRGVSALTSQVERLGGILSQLAGDSDAPDPDAIGGELVQAGREVQESARDGSTRETHQRTDPDDDELPPNVKWDRNSRKHVIVQLGGFRRRFAVTDPVMTGEMIKVQSSNVHSIGYRLNFNNPAKSKLMVRYLQGDKTHTGPASTRASVPGPLYEYDGINVDAFMAMKKAASKGKWVWDHLRIRGTRVGHQVQYKLAGISQSYMPRRATVLGGQEMFLRRTAKVGGRTVRSPLGDERLGDYRHPKGSPRNVNTARRKNVRRG